MTRVRPFDPFSLEIRQSCPTVILNLIKGFDTTSSQAIILILPREHTKRLNYLSYPPNSLKKLVIEGAFFPITQLSYRCHYFLTIIFFLTHSIIFIDYFVQM